MDILATRDPRKRSLESYKILHGKGPPTMTDVLRPLETTAIQAGHQEAGVLEKP